MLGYMFLGCFSCLAKGVPAEPRRNTAPMTPISIVQRIYPCSPEGTERLEALENIRIAHIGQESIKNRAVNLGQFFLRPIQRTKSKGSVCEGAITIHMNYLSWVERIKIAVVNVNRPTISNLRLGPIYDVRNVF